MFRSLLAHNQAAHTCIKQLSNRYTIPSMHTVALYREHAPFTVFIFISILIH